MLLMIKKGSHLKKASLTLALGVSDHSVQTWRKKYIQWGLEALLEEKRGGSKKPQINERHLWYSKIAKEKFQEEAINKT